MAEEVEMDQKVYDELIAEGKSERIATAKAKAAAVRARKASGAEETGSGEAADEAPAAEAPAAEASPAAAASAGDGDGAVKAGAGVATRERTRPAGGGPGGNGGGGGNGALTPEERQARVAAALKARGGDRAPQRQAALAGQDHTHRLLAMVPPTGIQQIRGKQDDKVYTWPHLISAEFVCLMVVTAVTLVFSVLVNAPLGDLANSNLTPNPSKAPWYFLGLQELLRYLHPMIAGVTLPGVMVAGIAAFPYIDRNPSVRPENRKTAYVMFTFFLVFWAVLTMIGSFFRGPGFNWVWPWVDGLWFTL